MFKSILNFIKLQVADFKVYKSAKDLNRILRDWEELRVDSSNPEAVEELKSALLAFKDAMGEHNQAVTFSRR